MKSTTKFFTASLLALVVAGALFVRVYSYEQEFQELVKVSLETTAGYDQNFIDMVNRLEDELALRASFGYSGEKDPMTGQKRSVVRSVPVKKVAKGKVPQKAEDPFRLAAIIYNDEANRFTAIMNLGERSMSVEVGDVIEGRVIRTISKGYVRMTDTKNLYQYDIEGTKKIRSLTAKDRGTK